MRRCFARVTATRDVSHVIHRRPHCSATYAVVPLPQVGSKTRSPGSVVMSIHRWFASKEVCTTYIRGAPNWTLSHLSVIIFMGKSSRYLLYLSTDPIT